MWTRRSVVAAIGAVAALYRAAVPGWRVAVPELGSAHRMRRRRPLPEPDSAYVFFDSVEAAFVEAACERLIPADAAGLGAVAAGAVRYMDRQLAGPWGSGSLAYRPGPWQPGTPASAAAAGRTPSALFRTALAAARRRAGTHDAAPTMPPTMHEASPGCATPFERWPAARQEAYLRSLAADDTDLDGVPSGEFFRMLLGMTMEGFFSDPRYAGSRDTIDWPLSGFPGACAATSCPPACAQETTGDVP
jgi:gluconate 2-dehydrogenase gamma chain